MILKPTAKISSESMSFITVNKILVSCF